MKYHKQHLDGSVGSAHCWFWSTETDFFGFDKLMNINYFAALLSLGGTTQGSVGTLCLE